MWCVFSIFPQKHSLPLKVTEYSHMPITGVLQTHLTLLIERNKMKTQISQEGKWRLSITGEALDAFRKQPSPDLCWRPSRKWITLNPEYVQRHRKKVPDTLPEKEYSAMIGRSGIILGSFYFRWSYALWVWYLVKSLRVLRLSNLAKMSNALSRFLAKHSLNKWIHNIHIHRSQKCLPLSYPHPTNKNTRLSPVLWGKYSLGSSK